MDIDRIAILTRTTEILAMWATNDYAASRWSHPEDWVTMQNAAHEQAQREALTGEMEWPVGTTGGN